jgi:hypothetical protein
LRDTELQYASFVERIFKTRIPSADDIPRGDEALSNFNFSITARESVADEEVVIVNSQGKRFDVERLQ